jgi:FAD/FMN-containing dehydrogenase
VDSLAVTATRLTALSQRKTGREYMTARDRDGNEIELDDALVKSLAGRIHGEQRSLWNGMIDRRPALIVRCLGTGDVVAGVTFARDHAIALCIKGGGHNIAGLAACDGGLMLDMSRQRGVCVDPMARVAHVQAGCRCDPSTS